jgi:hypothetical protein
MFAHGAGWQVSSFFTCCWLCGSLVRDVCTYWFLCERYVQRCVGEVLAGEGDVKKDERCSPVGPGCFLREA